MGKGRETDVYHYVKTLYAPTAVTDAVYCHFTSVEAKELIVATSTSVTIYRVEGKCELSVKEELPVHGRIVCMKAIQLTSKLCWLALFVEDQNLLLLRYNQQKACIESMLHSVLEKNFPNKKPGLAEEFTVFPQLILHNPASTGMAILGVQVEMAKLLFVVMREHSSRFKAEMFEVCIDEFHLIDMQFLLSTSEQPRFAILYEDTHQRRHLKTYALCLKTKSVSPTELFVSKLDVGVSQIMPVPLPFGGVLVFGLSGVSYYREKRLAYPESTRPKSKRVEKHAFSLSVGQIISVCPYQGRLPSPRYLMADDWGGLHLIGLMNQPSEDAITWSLERIGETSLASVLCPLSANASGDSQVIKLFVDTKTKKTALSVATTLVNVGSISDFTPVVSDPKGIVTCSGFRKDGTLRIIKPGISVTQLEAAPMKAPVKRIFAFEENGRFVVILVHPGSSRLFSYSNGNDGRARFEEVDSEQWRSIYQVLEVIECSKHSKDLMITCDKKHLRGWRYPDFAHVKTITFPTQGIGAVLHCGFLEQHAVVVTTDLSGSNSSARLICFHLPPVSDTRMGEIECTLSAEQFVKDDIPYFCTVSSKTSGAGFHDIGLAALSLLYEETILLVSLPLLSRVLKIPLFGSILRRPTLDCHSLLLVGTSESMSGLSLLPTTRGAYLFVSTTAGSVVLGTVKQENDTLSYSYQKKVRVGSTPVQLTKSRVNASPVVFCESDAPVMFLYQNANLARSDVNVDIDGCVSAIAGVGNKLLFADKASFSVGTISPMNKVHVKKIHLHEHPRRLCLVQPALRNKYALLSTKLTPLNYKSPVEHKEESDDELTLCEENFLHLIDGATWSILDTLHLDEFEQGICMASCELTSKDLFPGVANQVTQTSTSFVIVGTGYAVAGEEETQQGRLLVMKCTTDKVSTRQTSKNLMEVVHEEKMDGAVSALCLAGSVPGSDVLNTTLLVVAIEEKVVLYELAFQNQTDIKLTKLAQHTSNVLVVDLKVHQRWILVGDFFKSVTILQLERRATGTRLIEVARDYEEKRAFSVAFSEPPVGCDASPLAMLCADSNGGLFSLRRNQSDPDRIERHILRTAGSFRIGENVTCLKTIRNRVYKQSALGTEAGAAIEPRLQLIRDLTLSEKHSTKKKTGTVSASGTVQYIQAFGTISGAVGAIGRLQKDLFDFLKLLETSVEKSATALAETSDFRWKSPDSRNQAENFIDGDRIESVLTMSAGQQADVVAQLNLAMKSCPQNIVNFVSKALCQAHLSYSPDAIEINQLVQFVQDLSTLEYL